MPKRYFGQKKKALCFNSTSEEITIMDIGIHIASLHDQQGFNNFNPGAYVVADSGATIGFYKNSVNKTSVYAGQTFRPFGTLLITAGVVSGYRNSLSPFVIPSVDIGSGFRVAFVPQFKKFNSNATALHLMYEF
jgi:hypothetical protein